MGRLIGLAITALSIFITYEILKFFGKIFLFIVGWGAIFMSIAFAITPNPDGSPYSLEASIWAFAIGFLSLQFIKIFP